MLLLNVLHSALKVTWGCSPVQIDNAPYTAHKIVWIDFVTNMRGHIYIWMCAVENMCVYICCVFNIKFIVFIYSSSFMYIASQILYTAKHPQGKLSHFELEMAIHVKSICCSILLPIDKIMTH